MPGYELIDQDERNAVLDVFDSSGGVLFAHGFDQLRNGKYRVREFEQKFAEKMSANHALAVSSGSAALKIALSALNVGFGDEVIVPSFTFLQHYSFNSSFFADLVKYSMVIKSSKD